jgi:protein-S-isoprenylcysteine O-methyltransferase Ste14
VSTPPVSRLPSLGARGQGWVWLQSLLLGGVVLVGSVGPRWPDSVVVVLFVAGTLVFLAGVAQVAAGILAVGASFATMPQPKGGATLRTDGILGRVRHPIYGGWMLAAAGWALVFSPWCIPLVLLLVVELDLKTRVEERMLRAEYPDYDSYAERVRRRYMVVP